MKKTILIISLIGCLFAECNTNHHTAAPLADNTIKHRRHAKHLKRQHTQPKPAKHHRRQPYVRLDTNEPINAGDTLYVIAASKDSVFLYGK